MLGRIAMMLVVTGVAFMGMTRLDPAGPLLIILGATCAAITMEARLDLELAAERAATPEVDDVEPGPQPRAA